MGKLVEQEAGDEPASVLLEKIAQEKARLISEGKIKKSAPLPKISDDEKPFDLPDGWEWVQLDNLSQVITKGSSPKWQGVSYTDNENDVLFITSENVGSFSLKLDSKKYVELKFNEIEPRSVLQNGDFLMNIVGGSIGRTAIYNIETLANINQAVCLIRSFPQYLNSRFLLNFFNSQTCVSYMFDKQVDNARANLSMGNISKFLMPIPPLAEQQRIVAKVDELMALCEELKTKLNTAQTLQIQLAETLVLEAVG
jgi:type I restriction enzyme S subunit